MILPFIDPEDDIYINLCVLILLINALAKTSRGIQKLNNNRLHIFLYLLKNPTGLNEILRVLGKGNVVLQDRDTYSVTSISPNMDSLFDRNALKSLLSVLVAKKLVSITYKKGDGFFYSLSEIGKHLIADLNDEYLNEIRLLCEKLKSLLNFTEGQLNKEINRIILMGAV
ncbi:ABC-three component system middle component 4 [uncultured Shewanella sp.]|uniref:ABC-three component system middle component 4 n=1 Tax=uncultured Shewanella sp. TaxID=173975 RepID=UPI0026051511|nr:ABC-three component system middle component 4 [uncultured Shewanella sp.]